MPAQTPLYAIGDIHGQIDQLRQAIAWIVGRAAAQTEQNLKPKVVFLGDYVDRGEDSRAVLNCLIGLEAEFPSIQWIFLAGNHEAAMLGFLDNPLEHIAWLGFGGAETLLNYGVRPPVGVGGRAIQKTRDQLLQALPDTHLRFLQQLRHSHQCGDYLFVHAGLRPGVPLERQAPEDMLWIRDEFMNTPHWYGKCVVHGHTIETAPALHPWRIGIDSGAYCGGPLSCLVLTGNHREVIGFS
ncbi:metallophosphoesterase family protein [Magnetospirillum gryphiswaldense]|uniref:metallophosphoesterase family protein n=1 Tax=Magnetospirillum gryphiswaldense TaxID=55518 RepID=UPI00130E0D90|nr:metallophosphoesterase family protein [Magnetospirillum gryphiswaldense]